MATIKRYYINYIQPPKCDPTNYTELYKEYESTLMRQFFRLTKDYHLSEDLFHVTMANLWKSWNTFDDFATINNVIVTLANFAYMHYLRYLRNQTGFISYDEYEELADDILVATDGITPYHEFIREATLDSLKESLDGLSDSNRGLFIDQYVNGLSVDELKERYNKSDSNLWVSLHRIRNQLVKALNARGVFSSDLSGHVYE